MEAHHIRPLRNRPNNGACAKRHAQFSSTISVNAPVRQLAGKGQNWDLILQPRHFLLLFLNPALGENLRSQNYP